MKLASYFAALVSAEFDSAKLQEVNRRNKLRDYAGACATHDFIDANSLMYGAWCALYFAPPDLAHDDSVSDTMGQAWQIARNAGFDPAKIEG